jgi:ADP-ribose pyrophosphatase
MKFSHFLPKRTRANKKHQLNKIKKVVQMVKKRDDNCSGPIDVIGRTLIYSGNISLRVDRFTLNRKVIVKEIVEHSSSVGMIPIDDDLRVYLVKQYRHATGKCLLEIPAGKIEKGESPEKAACRELSEEIGYNGIFSHLTTFYLAPGYDTEQMHLFVCTDLKKVPRGRLDDDENISIVKMEIGTAIRKCLNGEIQDCKTIAGLLAYFQYLRPSQD